MKKFVVLILASLYLSASVGATVHYHFCMNEFVGWSLFHDKDDKCGRCGMDEKDKDGCCKDEHKHFKLKTDQQKANVSEFINLVSAPALAVPVLDFTFHASINITKSYPAIHAPPDIGKNRLHVLHCLFLI
jgi:hypothetical protein